MRWAKIPERVRTVIIFAPLPLLMVLWHPWTAWIVFTLLAVIATYEWRWIVIQNRAQFYTIRTRISMALVVASLLVGQYALMAGIAVILLSAAFIYNGEVGSRRNRLLMAQIMPSLIALFVVSLREQGLAYLGLALVVTAISDTMAYYVGRKFGRRKFAPQISPNKTWEGAIGGWIFAIIAAWIYCAYFLPEIAAWFVLAKVIFFWALAFAGQLGDLAESALKRAHGVKDSGSIFPGHGGVLDRFDSLGPVAVILAIGAFL